MRTPVGKGAARQGGRALPSHSHPLQTPTRPLSRAPREAWMSSQTVVPQPRAQLCPDATHYCRVMWRAASAQPLPSRGLGAKSGLITDTQRTGCFRLSKGSRFMLLVTWRADRAPLGQQGHPASSWPKCLGQGEENIGSGRGQVGFKGKAWPKAPLGRACRRCVWAQT